MTSQRLGFPRLRLLAITCAALTFVAAVDTADAQQPDTAQRRRASHATPGDSATRRSAAGDAGQADARRSEEGGASAAA